MTAPDRRWVARVLAAVAAGFIATDFASSALADTGNTSASTDFAGLLDAAHLQSAPWESSLFDAVGGGGSAVGAASDTVPPIVASYPLDLLDDASANLTEANQVVSGPVSDVAGMTQQTAAQNIALNEIASLYTAESSLSSYDNGAFADLLNPWFTAVDQAWDQGTEALLSADQAVAAAVAAGSGVDTAVFAVFGADFQLAGDMLNSFPIELIAGFIDPADLAGVVF